MTEHDDPIVPIDPDLDPADPAEPTLDTRRHDRRRTAGRAQPGVLVAIALGGVVGACARQGITEVVHTEPGHFPWATFWANLSGSFILGFVLVLLVERFRPTRHLRPFLVTGIIGAYTTMSTYLVDTAVLIGDGHVATALLYGVASVAAGLLLAYAGVVAARSLPHQHHAGPLPERR